MPSALDFDQVRDLHRAGDLDAAQAAYLALLALQPQDANLLHMLGILLAEKGDLKQAQHYLEQALALQQDDQTIYLHLANILRAQGLFDQAIVVLQQLIAKHPDYAGAQNNLGTLYFAQSNWQAAIAAFRQAIALQANYNDAYYNLALALTRANEINAAMLTYQALLDIAPQHPGAHFQLGSLLMRQQKFPAAIEHFLVVEHIELFYVEAQANLGACYLSLGKLIAAKSAYLKALECKPDDSQILFNLGVIAMQQGQVHEAIHFYLSTLNMDADSFAAHNNLGVAYLALQDSASALLHFRAALRLQPNNTALQHTINILTQKNNVLTSPPEYIRSLFDSYADHYDAHLTQDLHYAVPKAMYEMVATAVALDNQQWEILDLGCGTGLCAEVFRRLAPPSFVARFTGIDLSQKMLDIAAQKNIYDHLAQSDLLPYLNAHPHTYDLIMAGDVLVYHGDLAALFASVKAALRPGGSFIFNLEISASEKYQMTDSGRFAHNKDYVDALIKQTQFLIQAYAVVSIRTQNETEVQGHLYLLSSQD